MTRKQKGKCDYDMRSLLFAFYFLIQNSYSFDIEDKARSSLVKMVTIIMGRRRMTMMKKT